MINNGRLHDSSMNWIPPMGQVNQLRDALVRLSAAKYGEPRAVVEKRKYLTGPEVVSAKDESFSIKRLLLIKGIGSTFLDEWLAEKRQQLGGKPASNSTTVRPTFASPPGLPRKYRTHQGRPGLVNNAF